MRGLLLTPPNPAQPGMEVGVGPGAGPLHVGAASFGFSLPAGGRVRVGTSGSVLQPLKVRGLQSTDHEVKKPEPSKSKMRVCELQSPWTCHPRMSSLQSGGHVCLPPDGLCREIRRVQMWAPSKQWGIIIQRGWALTGRGVGPATAQANFSHQTQTPSQEGRCQFYLSECWLVSWKMPCCLAM